MSADVKLYSPSFGALAKLMSIGLGRFFFGLGRSFVSAAAELLLFIGVSSLPELSSPCNDWKQKW